MRATSVPEPKEPERGVVVLVLPQDAYDRIAKAAQLRGLTVGALVTHALASYLALSGDTQEAPRGLR